MKQKSLEKSFEFISELGNFVKIEQDSPVSFKIYFSENIFKIVQLTDMHFCNINFAHKKTIRKLNNLFKTINPNLIANTGDYFCKVPILYVKILLKLFDDNINYPWIFAWGNHDHEIFHFKGNLSNITKIEDYMLKLKKLIYLPTREYFENYNGSNICEDEIEREAIWNSIKNSLQFYLNSNQTDENVQSLITKMFKLNYRKEIKYKFKDKKLFDKKFDGFFNGNYLLKLYNKNSVHCWNIFILNSRRYNSIPNKVLNWMQVNENKVPSVCFYHVPDYAYHTIVENNVAKGIYREKVCFENDRGRIHQKFKKMDNFIATFVGHDHVNDYYAILDNRLLVYGRKTSDLAYGGRDYKAFQKLYSKGIRSIVHGFKIIELKMNYTKSDIANSLINHYTMLYDGKICEYPDELINFDFLKYKINK